MTIPALFERPGQVAPVTGFTRGTGKAIAQALVEAGAQVAVNSESSPDCQLYLASPADGFVTGHTLVVGGVGALISDGH